MSKNVSFAVLSGFCASTASTFGKLSGLPAFEGSIVLRASFFVCMVLCNAAVWTLFVKALHQTDSSLTATVISSGSNYVFSAFTGYLVFGETTSLFWWSGMFLIVIGLLLVLKSESKQKVALKND